VKTLCPQEYDGFTMRVNPCHRAACSNWSTGTRRCTVETGAEHLPLVRAWKVPDCPLAVACQHAVQSGGLCAVRERGMVCVSALATRMPYQAAMDHADGFHAMVVASPEEVAGWSLEELAEIVGADGPAAKAIWTAVA